MHNIFSISFKNQIFFFLLSEQPIYDNPKSPHFTQDACSLRRTRSLAVIREETYNDLQINGSRTRRSQLIPRAKLVNRDFFKDRSLILSLRKFQTTEYHKI